MKKQVTDLYHHLCPRYGTPTGFGYSSRTSNNTQSGIISLSTSTTLSSTPSRSITADFFWRYAGCLQELRISSILQNFLYIFFLIPEFRRWADCPILSQLWRLVVTHGTQKQNSHSALSLPLESGRGNVGRQFRGSAKGDLGISSSREDWAVLSVLHTLVISTFQGQPLLSNSCWTASFCSWFMPLKVRWKLISTQNLLIYKYNSTIGLHRFSVGKLEQ